MLVILSTRTALATNIDHCGGRVEARHQETEIAEGDRSMNRIALTAGIAVSSLAVAGPGLQITEAYTGISGPDGSADWIELTNFGNSAVSLDGLFYDDESADIAAGGDLPNIDLGAGESIVILVDLDAGTIGDEIADFEAVWGTGINVIGLEGGGSLSGSGDTAFILDAMSNLIDFVNTPGALSGDLQTIEFDVDGNAVLSQLGVNGAFESNLFDNDRFGGTQVRLIGSPGVIPAPSAFAALGLGGLVAARRRRA